MKNISWPYIMRIVLAVIAIFYVGHWVSQQEIPAIPKDPSALMWLGLALICLLPALFFRAAKWYLIIQPAYPDITLKEALKSYVGAMPLSLITPGRVGELARMLYLKPAPQGRMQGFFLVALDKIMDLGSLLFWASAGAYLFFGIELAGLVLLGSLIVLSFPLWMQKTTWFARLPLKLLGVDKDKFSFVDSSAYPTQRVLGIGICGFFCFGIEWLQTFLLLNIWHPDPVPFMLVCQVMSFVTLANILQLTFAGLGVREGLAGFWLKKFAGIPPIVGASSAFLLFVIDQIIPCLIGLKLKTHKELLDSVDQRIN